MTRLLPLGRSLLKRRSGVNRGKRAGQGSARVQFYIENRLEESTSLNAYQLLGWFRSRKEVPEALREAAKRLYVRVTPAGSLPHPNDPLQDAGAIIDAILQGQI
jgi:hypothetical protein